jgi:hypothetical protein
MFTEYECTFLRFAPEIYLFSPVAIMPDETGCAGGSD